jgi:hypothetical protein
VRARQARLIVVVSAMAEQTGVLARQVEQGFGPHRADVEIPSKLVVHWQPGCQPIEAMSRDRQRTRMHSAIVTGSEHTGEHC